MRHINQYLTIKPEQLPQNGTAICTACNELHLQGTEVFMDDIVPRNLPLFKSDKELAALIQKLQQYLVKRVHCSYWAWPTAILSKTHFSELIANFGGKEAVKSYFGDLTGKHLFERWVQEYQLACKLNAQSYTFHLIDYAPIDGRWSFSISREEILQNMVLMIQGLLNELDNQDLLTDNSPNIEVENAGFGLEYGMQTVDDVLYIFSQLYDEYHKVRIGWDLNHLLHAIGIDSNTKKPSFFLPAKDISPWMQILQNKHGNSAAELGIAWLRANILDPRTRNFIGSLHVSDCVAKTICYFENGQFCEPYLSELTNQPSWTAMEEYGVRIVLNEYDSHVIAGKGMLDINDLIKLIEDAAEANQQLVILHELKNELNVIKAVKAQISALSISQRA